MAVLRENSIRFSSKNFEKKFGHYPGFSRLVAKSRVAKSRTKVAKSRVAKSRVTKSRVAKSPDTVSF